MVEPVTGGLIAGGLLSAAGGVLGAAADLHGLGGPRVLRQMIDRFEAAPDETQVFYAAIWKAAVRATHGCVQQVYDHTAATDDVRGDTPSWDRFCEAHARVRKVREWSDAPTLPQALQDALTCDLTHTLHAQAQPDDAGPSSAAQAVWASYCIALRDAGMQGEPPAVIRQAFFDERPEAKVWSWSRHFALRIGEQLRDDNGFKAMFDATQFADIGSGVARLIADFANVEQVLAEMSAKLDAVQETIHSAESNITQGQEKILEAQQRSYEDLSAKLDSLIASQSNESALRQEVLRLRQRPDIHLEDLFGWLQTALNRSDPLPPNELPRLLQQALTIDLPKLRAETEHYRLDPLASLEAQALLDEVRALLHPQGGTPLDLQAASEKLKALDDRVVAERAARRRDEDNDLARLRVLRAEAERSMAHHAAAAELMEQAASFAHNDLQAREWNEQAAEDWFKHGELYPGLDALYSAIRLLSELLMPSVRESVAARLYSNLGVAQSELGMRLEGEEGSRLLYAAEINLREAIDLHLRAGRSMDLTLSYINLGSLQRNWSERFDGEGAIQTLHAALESYQAALKLCAREKNSEEWAMIHNNVGNAQRAISELTHGEARIKFLHAAEASLQAALEIHDRTHFPVRWALTQDNLGSVLQRLGEQLDGGAAVQTLRAAEASHLAALDVFTRKERPLSWAMTKNNLGVAQQTLGERLYGEAGLKALLEARASYQAALEVLTHNAMPVQWGTANQNLARVEQLIAESNI